MVVVLAERRELGPALGPLEQQRLAHVDAAEARHEGEGHDAYRGEQVGERGHWHGVVVGHRSIVALSGAGASVLGRIASLRATPAVDGADDPRARRRLLGLAALEVGMPDDLDRLGVEADEVRHDSAGRNVLIGVIGLILVIGALIPLAIGAVWVGTFVYAGVVSLLDAAPAALVP